jgi:putative restriction endonuclease
MRLVNAAHILPVPVTGSIDHVTNGIALSPTMHLVYDTCLIYLDENYFMRINKEKASELVALNLSAGLDQLKKYMDAKIHLPANKKQWPEPQFIKEANKHRLIPGY